MVAGAAADTVVTPLIHMPPRMDTDGAIRVTSTMVGVTDGITTDGIMTADTRMAVDGVMVVDSRMAADVVADMTSPIQDMAAEAIAADPTKQASNFTCTIV